MGAEMAPMKNPSVAHHHTSPAAALAPQQWRQAGLRQRCKSQGQMLFAALEPQRRGQIPGHGPVLLHKHRDVQEACRTGQGLEVVQTPARLTGA